MAFAELRSMLGDVKKLISRRDKLFNSKAQAVVESKPMLLDEIKEEQSE